MKLCASDLYKREIKDTFLVDLLLMIKIFDKTFTASNRLNRWKMCHDIRQLTKRGELLSSGNAAAKA